MRTNVANVYAIGDVTGMYELAHVASKQGEVVAEYIMGIKDNKIDYLSLPVCVFTYPEVAFVGDLHGDPGNFRLLQVQRQIVWGIQGELSRSLRRKE